MQRSSSCKFQRYCYVQYEGLFNTIEQVVFIEQNQCHQTKKIKNFRAISLKKIELLLNSLNLLKVQGFDLHAFDANS